METKENKDIKNKNSKKRKRQVSIITVFLWIFLVAIMVTIVKGNIKNTNALEETQQEDGIISGEYVKIYTTDTPNIDTNTVVKGRSKHHGSITVKVGEKANLLGSPVIERFCSRGHLISLAVPKLYYEVALLYDEDFIDNFNGEIGKDVYQLPGEDYYFECLAATTDVIKPGRTTIELSYYVNFDIEDDSNTHYCDRCYDNNYYYEYKISKDNKWYSCDDTFDIIATVDYNLNYDDNASENEVSSMPDSESIENSSEEYSFNISEKIPVRDGYEFLGWAEEDNKNEIKYKGGEDITLKWESGGTVDKTLYAVWRKINSDAYVVRYSWKGLPEDANIKLPNDELAWRYSEVNVDDRKAGDIVTIDGVEYEFSGWSTKDAEVKNNKFIMPGKDVYLVGEWAKKEDVKIKLVGRKEWEDNDNIAGKRPESTILQVKVGDEVVEEQVVNEESNWSYEFELAKYDENLNKIEYTIDEKEVTNKFYIKEKVEKISDTEFVITNKFEVPYEKKEILVEKIWLDEENKYEKRPSSIILQIKNKEEIVEEVEVNETDEWKHEFEVAKYDELGNEIEYTVDEREKNEEDLKYYEKIIEGNVITNKCTYKPVIDTSDINIIVYVVIFFVAIIGVIVGVCFVRKNKLSKI